MSVLTSKIDGMYGSNVMCFYGKLDSEYILILI